MLHCREVLLGVSVRGKFYISVVLLSLILFSAAGAAWASGQRESQLTAAEQLIHEKRYNEAILILTSVMKRSPRQFDRAQALLRQIEQARSYYNSLLAEIIRLFNQGKLDQAYALIQKLEALDQNPNGAMAETQSIARQALAVIANAQQFQALMDKAVAYLKRGDYPAAMTTYLSGLSLGQDLFLKGNFGNIAVNRVDALRADIKASGEEFSSLLGRLGAEQARVENDSGSIEKLNADLPGYLSTLSQLAALRGRIEADSAALNAVQRVLLNEKPSTSDVQLITFIDGIVHGRQTAKSPEGVLATIDTPWDDSIAKVTNGIVGVAQKDFAAAQTAFDAKQWSAATDSFRSALDYALVAEKASAAWGMRVPVGPDLKIASAGWTVINRELPGYLDIFTLAQAADSYLALTQTAQSALRIGTVMTATTASLQELTAEGNRIGPVLATAEAIRTTWNDIKSSLTALEQRKIDTSASLRRADSVLAAVAAVESGMAGSQVRIVVRAAELRFAPVEKDLADAQQSVQKAQQLVNGVSQGPSGTQGTPGVKRKYPDQARQILVAAQAKLGKLGELVSAAESQIAAETEPVRAASAVQDASATARRIANEIQTLQATATSTLSQAQSDIFQADRFAQAGNAQLQQAEAAIGRGEFATARQSITQAASSYDRSLSYSEDPAVRQIRDVQIPQLSQQVADSENAVVVRQVRTYINQGRALYAQGNYTQAQDVFLRAQAQWRTTNNQDDPEISSWLKYVDTALSINSGRIVSPTDPLYPEITQLLNLAEDDYNSGKQLLAQGDRNAAQRYFNDAEQKLLYVQIPFPLNEEARVLSLKILQLTDPTSFRATFQQKFDKALAELQTNPQTAYVSLQDLKVVDQTYPGLSSALNRAEILTGIKRPPPDPAKIAQSQSLYQKAYDIVRTNVTAQYPIAMSYLNQAIELDPNNEQAAALKDRIAIAAGAETTVVLSSSAQTEFRQAEEQFIAKNYYEALRIVTQLLADPQNQNYYPLIELKRRIQSKI